MKKIKLLAGLSALTTIGSSVAMAATGCSNDGSNKNKDDKLVISFNYSDSDVISPEEVATWTFNISYNSNPATLKKLEVTSSNTQVATVKVPDPTKQEFEITGKANGTTRITVKVTDTNGHYNELEHEVYVSGEAVTAKDNYIGTIYGRYKLEDDFGQADINQLVPNYNKEIIIAGAAISPEILTELHIVKTEGNVINFPDGFLKGCTNLKKLDLSGIKTTSIQNTYLAYPVLGEFSVNRLQELAVPELVATSSVDDIILTDFLHSETGMPSLKKVDLTGFKNVKRIKGWWFCNKCTALTDINLSAMENLVEVGVAFMHGCSAIENVDLSAWTKVQVIRNSFMIECTSLKSLDMSKLSSLKLIGAEFLKNCTSLEEFRFPGNYYYDEGVLVSEPESSVLQSIGWDTEYNSWGAVYGQFLYGCTSLKSIDFTTINPGKDGIGFTGAGQPTDAEADFNKDHFPQRTIYLEQSGAASNEISYMLFGCSSLEEVNFGTLIPANFGYADGTVNHSAFYTKPFETEDEVTEYFEDETKGILFDGNHVSQLVDPESSSVLFATDDALQIGNLYYARKWLEGAIKLTADIETKPENGSWEPGAGTNPGTFEVLPLTGATKATLQFTLSSQVTDGTWTVEDSSTNTSVTGAQFTVSGTTGTLTVDSTNTLTSDPELWTIKCSSPTVKVKDFSLYAKIGEPKIVCEYDQFGSGTYEPFVNGGYIRNYLQPNSSKVSITVKNAPVSEDNLVIVSCIPSSHGTLNQSTEIGKKNTAIWSYTGGLVEGQTVMFAAFDKTDSNKGPLATFFFYTGDYSSSNSTEFYCDQSGAFKAIMSGPNTTKEGIWTNPASDSVKKWEFTANSYFNKSWGSKIWATYYDGGEWKVHDVTTSGSNPGNNLKPTFVPWSSSSSSLTNPAIKIETIQGSAAKPTIYVMTTKASRDNYDFFCNYILYINVTN